MATAQQFDQAEYRWQPEKGLTPVATSLPDNIIGLWHTRLGKWVRHPAVGSVKESVRYQVFDDGTAALAWRRRDPRGTGHEAASRPEMSRVLVGPERLLSPELAAAICCLGLPTAIGPDLGLVAIGDVLPRIDAEELRAAVQRTADELDGQAEKERQGLQRIIAPALAGPGTPLSVLLPANSIGQLLRDGPQGRLLWGMFRILRPVLGTMGIERGWSFSTLEPPLGDTQTDTLPGTVFRAEHVAAPGIAVRRETRVRPYDPAAPSATPEYEHLAGLLVAAYETWGGDEMRGYFDGIEVEYLSLDERLEAICADLGEKLPFVPAPSSPAVPVRGGLMPPPVAQARREPSPSSPVQPPAMSPPAAPAPLPAPRPQGIAASERSKAEATKLPENGHHRVGAEASSLGAVLHQIHGSPDPREFESAATELCLGSPRSDAPERAAVRGQMPGRGWYLDAARRYDTEQPDILLKAIFRLSVLPDMSDPEVAQEVARWITSDNAPKEVIGALNDVAASGPKDVQQQMASALYPAIGRRWITLKGFRVLPAADVAAAAAGEPGRHSRAPEPQARTNGAGDGPAFYLRQIGDWAISDPVRSLGILCAVELVLIVLLASGRI